MESTKMPFPLINDENESIQMLVHCAFPDLRKCEEQGELLMPVVFILLVVLSVLLYFAVSLMDPGFVLSDTVKVDMVDTLQNMPNSPKMHSTRNT